MDSAQNPRQPGTASTDERSAAPKDPSVPSNVRAFPAPDVVAADIPEAAPPKWMARLMMFVFVAFCIEVGLVLITVPWIPHLWDENSLLAAWPNLRAFLAHNFVRGAVTGIGLLDIWFGVYEAVHYHDPKP
jgi:hypothetical protein